VIAVSSRARVAVPESGHHELREPRELVVVAGLADGEHQRHRLRQETARDERERLRGHAIEPLRIVDETDHRSLLGCVGEQAEHRQSDQEPVRCVAVGHAERRPQRVALQARQSLQPVEQWGAELMQTGERQLHLGLHAGHAGDTTSGRAVTQVVQERGLAHARLAAQDQDPALPGAHVFQEPVEHLALSVPAAQPRARSGLGHGRPRVEPAPRRLQARAVSGARGPA
jgi:hypothetical protein